MRTLVIVLLMGLALVAGLLATRTWRPGNAERISRLLLASHPVPESSRDDQSCVLTFQTIDSYSTQDIRAGIALFARDSGLGHSGGPDILDAYTLVFALDRYLFNLPTGVIGTPSAQEGEAWPVVRDRSGKLQLLGMHRQYFGGDWFWDKDFDACSKFGRRNGRAGSGL